MKKIVITEYKGLVLCAYFKEDKLTEIRGESKDKPSILGNIYIGKVKKIVPNIKSAFVDIGRGEDVFYSLENNKNHIFTHKPNAGDLKEGDEIVIKIKKEGNRLKKATGTSKGIFKDEEERNKLMEKWGHRSVFSLLRSHEPLFIKMYEDLKEEGVEKVVTDMDEVYSEFKENDKLNVDIRKYNDDSYPLFKLYSFEKHIENLLSPKVWLKSGGFLIISPTEALTVIDVNTGKSIGKKGKEEHILEINKEAGRKICEEVRLRNISGIIIADFIDMEKKEYLDELLDFMKKESKDTLSGIDVHDITRLNLMEMTRKKERGPAADMFNIPYHTS